MNDRLDRRITGWEQNPEGLQYEGVQGEGIGHIIIKDADRSNMMWTGYCLYLVGSEKIIGNCSEAVLLSIGIIQEFGGQELECSNIYCHQETIIVAMDVGSQVLLPPCYYFQMVGFQASEITLKIINTAFNEELVEKLISIPFCQ